MKVPVWVSIEKEVDVEITIDTIRAAIYDNPIPVAACKQMLNNVLKVLKAVPDDIIFEIGEPSRRIIADSLRQQANRYMANTND